MYLMLWYSPPTTLAFRAALPTYTSTPATAVWPDGVLTVTVIAYLIVGTKE